MPVKLFSKVDLKKEFSGIMKANSNNLSNRDINHLQPGYYNLYLEIIPLVTNAIRILNKTPGSQPLIKIFTTLKMTDIDKLYAENKPVDSINKIEEQDKKYDFVFFDDLKIKYAKHTNNSTFPIFMLAALALEELGEHEHQLDFLNGVKSEYSAGVIGHKLFAPHQADTQQTKTIISPFELGF